MSNVERVHVNAHSKSFIGNQCPISSIQRNTVYYTVDFGGGEENYK